ncbi:MAG: type II toxin-antitoxin system HicA family toxin [Gemmatimonadetes bacterium]|nr:type II toxin-antitoxin system HicA family toxin [Gemmatimonadota bacterium]
MPQVPLLSAYDVVQTFEALGWRVARPGNHIKMVKAGHPATLSVPNHKIVARGTLRGLIGDAGLTIDEFLEAT